MCRGNSSQHSQNGHPSRVSGHPRALSRTWISFLMSQSRWVLDCSKTNRRTTPHLSPGFDWESSGQKPLSLQRPPTHLVARRMEAAASTCHETMSDASMCCALPGATISSFQAPVDIPASTSASSPADSKWCWEGIASVSQASRGICY